MNFVIRIGIIGGNEVYHTLTIILNLYKSVNIAVKSVCINNEEDLIKNMELLTDDHCADLLIATISEDIKIKLDQMKLKFRILIFIKDIANFKLSNMFFMNHEDIIIINSDDKAIFKSIISEKSDAKLVTCGFNMKASITASSISEVDSKIVQYCIQRDIPTFSGKIVERQEFPVYLTITDEKDIYSILAGVTAAIINDYDIKHFNKIYV